MRRRPRRRGLGPEPPPYYVFAYLYVVFAVDSIYLFPWATVLDAPGYGATTLVEMGVFIAFLGVGLLYAWRKGVLSWR